MNLLEVLNKKESEEILFDSFEFYQLCRPTGFKKLKEELKQITIKELIIGPYVLKMDGDYYCGDDETFERMNEKGGKSASVLFNSILDPLIKNGLSQEKALNSTFVEFIKIYWAFKTFGGKFTPCSQKKSSHENLSIPF